MRRADRLFQIVQILRRGRVVTAHRLADELEVSERTIYRDIQDLSLSGVPVLGEAGVGYTLPPTFDLPPLRYNEEENEALVLGARMVKRWADRELARAAEGVLAKVEVVLPERLKKRIESTTLFVPGPFLQTSPAAHLGPLRTGINEQRKIHMAYQEAEEALTERKIQPLGLFFWGKVWTLAGWCELREGFRNFRIDRIARLEVLPEPFEPQPGRTLEDFFNEV